MITPIINLTNNIFAKFEAFNVSGSHKVRAAHFIISSAIKKGQIIPGKTTVIEKTGGNFGFGLIYACNEFNLDIELAIGLSFSKKKRLYLEALGAKLIGKEMLERGKTPKEVVEYHLQNANNFGKDYFYTDQFNNIDSLNGHLKSTGPEICHQLINLIDSRELFFVSCAGTGASLMGIRKSLIANGFSVKTCLVEPSGCDSENEKFTDHRFEGMAVGVSPPFINWNDIDIKIHIDFEIALDEQKYIAKKIGQFVGNTSAACVAASRIIEKENPHTPILTMIYDHGLWYDDLITR